LENFFVAGALDEIEAHVLYAGVEDKDIGAR
jgi:hypothetical protein